MPSRLRKQEDMWSDVHVHLMTTRNGRPTPKRTNHSRSDPSSRPLSRATRHLILRILHKQLHLLRPLDQSPRTRPTPPLLLQQPDLLLPDRRFSLPPRPMLHLPLRQPNLPLPLQDERLGLQTLSVLLRFRNELLLRRAGDGSVSSFLAVEVASDGFLHLGFDARRDLDGRSEFDKIERCLVARLLRGRPRWLFGIELDVTAFGLGLANEELDVLLLVQVISGGLAFLLGVEGEIRVGVEVLFLLEVVERVSAELAAAVLVDEEGGGTGEVGDAPGAEGSDAFGEMGEEDVDVVGGSVEVERVGETVVEGDDCW